MHQMWQFQTLDGLSEQAQPREQYLEHEKYHRPSLQLDLGCLYISLMSGLTQLQSNTSIVDPEFT